jgi:hypothetical protein
MKKIQFIPVLVAVLFVLAIASSCGKKQDVTQKQNAADSLKKDSVTKDVKSDKVTEEPALTVGYIYWVPPAMLDEHWAAVITGEIVSLDNAKKRSGDSAKNEVFGIVKVDRVLLSEPTVDANMQDQKFIKTDALKGFKPGDKVLIYFVKHEKGYAIKRDNVKKISGPDDELLGLTERYIKNSQNTESILSDPKEYRLWGKYDVGTASRLMQEREEKQKVK